MPTRLRNIHREPKIPARFAGHELFLGVPHCINQTASAVLGEAMNAYGKTVMHMVWAAIPWLPHDADPLIEPERDRVAALPASSCPFGVAEPYLEFAAWLYTDLVELYDRDVARQFWEKMPFLPALDRFHPETWIVARGGKPY